MLGSSAHRLPLNEVLERLSLEPLSVAVLCHSTRRSKRFRPRALDARSLTYLTMPSSLHAAWNWHVNFMPECTERDERYGRPLLPCPFRCRVARTLSRKVGEARAKPMKLLKSSRLLSQPLGSVRVTNCLMCQKHWVESMGLCGGTHRPEAV